MKNKVSGKMNEAQERVANAIVQRVTAFQHRLAMWLQAHSEHLSIRVKKIILVLSVISGLCTSAYIMITGMGGYQVTRISVDGVHLPTMASESPTVSTLSAQKELKKIKAFRLYMDSLQQTITGSKIADSILVARPGLLDSILVLEHLYQLNKK